jgi:nucleoside 2-deoxyribosyltransferase
MNIYFAGAIRGGRQDAARYKKIIAHLQRFGTVLTEHVGNETLLLQEKCLSEEEIFTRDMQWLEQADILIAEVTTPSLGVGYELAAAEQLNIPCLCLFNTKGQHSLSAMISGNPYFSKLPYRTLSDITGPMESFIKGLS